MKFLLARDKVLWLCKSLIEFDCWSKTNGGREFVDDTCREFLSRSSKLFFSFRENNKPKFKLDDDLDLEVDNECSEHEQVAWMSFNSSFLLSAKFKQD